MPQFLTAEKERLRADLLVFGKQLFINQGPKKTSLEQLTQAVGIAKSTFYAFFDSKEAMYLELLEMEADDMEVRVWNRVKQTNNAYDGIKAYLQQMVKELATNLLTKRLMTHPEELEMVKRKVTPEFVERKMQRNVMPLLEYIIEQQEKGGIVRDDPFVIIAFMRAAMLMELHRQDIGEELYPQVEEMMFHSVASTLAELPNNNEE